MYLEQLNIDDLNVKDVSKLYLEENLNAREIAELYGCSTQKIVVFCRENHIHKKFYYEDWLKEEYVNKQRTILDIAQEMNTDREEIRKYLRKYNIETDYERARIAGKKYHFNERIFQNIDTAEKAYWLGFITADGCIECMQRTKANGEIYSNYRLRICLSAKDKEHLIKFRHFIGDDNIPIMDHYTKIDGYEKLHHVVSIKICCKQLALDLMEKGIVPNKSTKECPPEYLPQSLIPHFIRGELDGDGCIFKDKYSVKINICGGKDLMEWIYNQNSQRGYVYKDKISPALYTYNIFKQEDVKDFLNWIYKDSTIHLSRKYEIFKNSKLFDC